MRKENRRKKQLKMSLIGILSLLVVINLSIFLIKSNAVNASNEQVSGSVDLINPIPTITISQSKTYDDTDWCTEKWLEVGVSDEGSKPHEYTYSLDEGVNWQQDKKFLVNKNGEYRIWVRDNAIPDFNIFMSELIKVEGIDEFAPIISLDNNTIPSQWCNNTNTCATFNFTVTDYNQSGCKSVTGEVENGTVTIERLNIENGQYRATITANEGMIVDGKVRITAMDYTLKETEWITLTNVRVDNFKPYITSIEEKKFDTWMTNPATFEFAVEDLGAPDVSIYGQVNNGEVEIVKKDGTSNIFIAKVYAKDNGLVNSPVRLTATDAVGNQSYCVTSNHIKVDKQPLCISNIAIEKLTGTPDKTVVKNGDVITVSFTLNDGEGSGINNSSVKVCLNNSKELLATNNENVYSVSFIVDSDFKIENKTIITLTKILYEDNAGNASHYMDPVNTQMIYYAPIAINSLNMVSNNAITNNKVARDNDVIIATFDTNHPVMVSNLKIADKDVSFTSEDGEHWLASYTVENGAIADNEFIKLFLTIIDCAGNEAVEFDEDDTLTDKITYYAPIELTTFSIVSNNTQGNMVAKDGDTITLNFESNHEVQLVDASIAGKSVATTQEKSGEFGQRWTVTYQIKNGDLADLSLLSFTILASDIAGNEKKSNTELHSNEILCIQYYAPITADTSLTSSNPNKEFVKNGDTLLLTCQTNHPVMISQSTIFERSTQISGNNSTQIFMEYQIPIMETTLEQGEVPFQYVVTDLAGNSYETKESNKKILQKITYDRTKPLSEISPNKITFTAKAILFHVGFQDENLSPQDISVKVNETEMITEEDRTFVSGNNFVKEIKLNQDGEYTIQACSMDKAGNKSNSDVLTKITVDRSKPTVKGVGITITQPTVHKPGFIIGEYFAFDDENIKEILCTLTNNNGTFDWDLNEPITVDGKNTISLIVIDMAGNTSETITYDMYVDSLNPKPLVKEEINQVILNSSDVTTLFDSKVKLNISLESLNIPDISNPDQFIMLQLLDNKETLVMDLLKEIQPQDGKYSVSLHQTGNYILVAKAQDDVGNQTELMTYHFELREEERYNVVILASIMTIVIGIGTFLIWFTIKKRNTL